MAVTVTGQVIYDEVIIRLGGLSNAFGVNDITSFMSDGLGEVWAVLRSLENDYFMEDTQTATSTADDYFAALTTSTREYDLPTNCREIRAMEVTTTGYETTVFEYRPFSDEEFQQERRQATADGAGSGTRIGKYLFTVVGMKKLILAQFLEAAMTVKVWYVKSLDELTTDTVLTEVVHPFWRKIVDYAVERATLSVREETLSDRWLTRWREDVKTLALSAGPRVTTGPLFIQEYEAGYSRE